MRIHRTDREGDLAVVGSRRSWGVAVAAARRRPAADGGGGPATAAAAPRGVR